jgi:hypothetical protein
MSTNYMSVRLRCDALPTPTLQQLTPADMKAFDARAYVQ